MIPHVHPLTLATGTADTALAVAIALIAGVGIGAAAVRLFAIRNRWAHPLRRLSETVKTLSADGWSARADVDGADEVRRLGRQVNSLAEHTQARLAALSDETASLKLLVDALPDPILVSDARDRIVLINAPAERLLQVPPQQVLGRPFVAAVNDPAIVDLFETCTSKRDERRTPCRPMDREIKLLRRGQRVMFHAHAEPTRTGGLLIVLRDVTTLAATIQMKTDFVANASHELRTPISAIKVAFETLRDVYQEQCSPDDALGSRCITIIGDHLRRLEEMLRDLLDLSRVENADLRPSLAPVRLRELVTSLRAVWMPNARDKGVELILPDTDGEGDITFTSDRRLLDLVLKNLVENAIKFTPAGGRVEVTYAQRPTGEDGAGDAIVLAVSDTGCGIPAEHAERVFERFYQVDAARSGTAGRGTGLGLAIVKHAVHALSGQVSLTSRPGAGTRIVCTLPVLETAERA